MASSRQMRRTALSSLKAPPTIRDQSFKNNDLDLNNTPPGIDDWQEPAPRQPVPSFEDYKGLERHGVLEHMAPLGSFPGSKMKARMRQYEPTRRIMHSKNGETRPPRDEVVTPEPPPPPPPDAPVLLLPRHDGPAPVLSSTRDFNDSSIYDPRLFTGETPTLVSPTVPQSIAVQPTPSPRTQAASTQTVVRNAIQRSNALGNPTLGVALQKLYEEARYDQEYLGLLNAVLSQTTSTEQSVHFQKFLKSARKQAKRNEREQSTRQTGSSLPTSQEKNLRSGATPRSVSSDVKIFNDQSVLLNAADTPSKSAKPPTSNMPMNGVPPDKRPSPKRMKRSSSTSTDSSLSSLNSDIEKLAPDGIDPDLLKPGHPAQLPPGLSLGGASMLSSNASPEQTNADEALALRRRLARKWDNYPVGQSSVRSAISPPRKPTPPPTALQQRAQQSRRNGPERKTQGGYDSSSDSPLSSQDEMLPPPPYGVRGITPQLGRPPKATKKAVRIKQSPLKKRNGVTAGLAQPIEPEVPHANSGRNEDSIAEPEVCSACSGNGSLVLCDGCPRGYHFTCCDPPLHPETRKEELPEQWFCRRCASAAVNKNISPKPRGLWTELNKAMQSRNPTAFHLPRNVRDYFEGVTTGEEGEYEEMHNVKLSKARSGYEEIPENLRLKDRKDNTILCFRCGESSNGKREIVPCDYCNLCWHLDCLDPPLASAPNKKTTNGKPRQAWMCPNHVDHDLVNLKATHPARGKIKTPALAQLEETQRVFRTRRPKQAHVVEIGLRRGFKNNGVIEIDEDTSEDDSDVEREMSGVTYRVPERGIKLDFIDRIKQTNLENRSFKTSVDSEKNRRRKPQHIQTSKKTDRSTLPNGGEGLGERPFRERKAALNLTQMARLDEKLDADRVANLIQTLTAEAPPGVEALFSSAEVEQKSNKASTENGIPSPLDEQERQDLEALIRLARSRLQSSSP